MSLTRQIAQIYLRLTPDALPASARHAARLSLADGLAVMLAAGNLEPAVRAFGDVARIPGMGGTVGAARLLTGGWGTVSGAALANGALSHAIDYEDTFDPAGLHPNAAAIPVLLALAEAEGKTLGDVVAALAVGCDLACRIGLSLCKNPAVRGWYHPPMIGAAGAALSGAHLLGLDADETVAALSLTLTGFALTDALKRSPKSDLRAVRDGFAAQAAVDAVLLARAGVRGTDDPLAEPGGLGHLLTGTAPDQAAFQSVGQSFLNTQVTIKTWPCCRGTHPAIAAALDLRKVGVTPDDIVAATFTVRPPDDMLFTPLADRQAPQTAIGAKFSIPYAFANTVIHGAPGLAAFGKTARSDPSVLHLAARVTMRGVDPVAQPIVDITYAPRTPNSAPGAAAALILPAPPSLIADKARFADIAAKLSECCNAAGLGPRSLAALMASETASGQLLVRDWLSGILPPETGR